MRSKPNPTPRPTVGPTGTLLWSLGSDRFQLMWTGPGSTRLYLVSATNLVPIEPDRFHVPDGTAKTAKRAAALFIAEGSSEED